MNWSPSTPTTLLVLVRHGQASYLEGDDYDRLSPLGERQARRLGDYWREHDTVFDAAFTGPADRHRKTAALVAEQARWARNSGRGTWVLEEFDEFPGEQVVRIFTPILMERHEHIRELALAFEAARTKSDRKQALDRLFPEVARRWVENEISSPRVESWQHFTDRVARGIKRIRRTVPIGSSVVVFTSAGPTAVAVSLALGVSPAETLNLAFRPRNASYSEFFLEDGKLRLNSFNATPHLDEPGLLTNR